MNETLKLDTHGAVAELRFANAPLNYATVTLLRLIADALEACDARPDIRAVVLSAEGKTFCAGADLASPNGFGAVGDDPLREFYDQALRIFACGKPVVAVVQGAAIGAGLGLAVAADFRVAAPEARFSANFTRLGFHPGFGLTYTLPRVIGSQRASRMFLGAARHTAEEGADWGLVDRLAASGAAREAALAFAQEIAENAPLALLATRATLRAGLLDAVRETLRHEHQQQLILQRTEDFAEGVRAVAERRPGRFQGR